MAAKVFLERGGDARFWREGETRAGRILLEDEDEVSLWQAVYLESQQGYARLVAAALAAGVVDYRFRGSTDFARDADDAVAQLRLRVRARRAR